MPFTLSQRKLVTSSLYMGSVLCAITSLINASDEYSSGDLTLSICGLIPWGLAAVQSLYDKCWTYYKREDYTEIENALPSESEKTPEMPRSTWSLINSSLHITSASVFIVGDLLDDSTSSNVLIPRLSGSMFWLSSALIGAWSACAIEKHQEEHPESVRKSCGMDALSVAMLCELLYMLSGMLYAISIWSDNPVNPLKVTGNFCWLIAGTHDLITACLDKNKDCCVPQEGTLKPLREPLKLQPGCSA